MKKSILIAAVFGTLAVTSCKKEEPTPPPVNNTSSLSNYFTNNLNDEKQAFTINASTYNEIVGAEGVKIMIPANSFKDASGNNVTGNMTIELIEILDQSKMILTGMPTTSNGSLLVSGGQLNVKATQSGSQVYLKNTSSIQVMVPTSAPDMNMALFDGITDSNGDVNWVPLDTDTSGAADSVIVVQDSTGGSWGNYYYFNWSDSTLGWINCDYFYASPDPLTTLSAALSSDYDATNTAVYIHVSSINSIAPLWYDGTNFASYTNSIPVGLSVTVVCISEINGDYFSAFVPVTVTANMVVPVTMNATTLAAIENDILNL